MSTAAAAEADPVVRPRPEHPISRSSISENTLKVLYRLHKTGYKAYLCGGGVRDLLLGRRPKDFDVATDARPEEIRFSDGLPKTRSGKIMRRLLKEIAAGSQTVGDVTTLEDLTILDRLREEEE